MPRSLIILGVLAALVAVGGLVGVPYIQRKLVSESLQVRVKIRSAFVDENVYLPVGTETVPRIVAEIEIAFPMGRTPEDINDLGITGDDGQALEVNWGGKPIEKNDNEDEGVSRWVIPEAFLPPDFKQGWLGNKRTGVKELYYIRMPPLPFNAP